MKKKLLKYAKAFKKLFSMLMCFLMGSGSMIAANTATSHAETRYVTNNGYTSNVYFGGRHGNYYHGSQPIYCVQPGESGLGSRSYKVRTIGSNTELTKVLYYGYGGDGYESAGKKCFGSASKNAYTATHFMAAYAFYHGYGRSDGNEYGAYKMNQSATLKAIYEKIQALPNPEKEHIWFDESVEKGEDEKELEVSVKGNKKVSEDCTINGTKNLYFTLKSTKNVSITNKSTGKTASNGDSIKVYGGQTFYLTAPLSYKGDWDSGELDAGSSTYKIIEYNHGTSSQLLVELTSKKRTDEVSADFDTETSYQMYLKKVDEDTGKAIEGVELTVTKPGKKTGKAYKTAADGFVRNLTITKPGTYKIEETDCPYPYTLPDNPVKNVNITQKDIENGGIKTVTFKDKEQDALLKIHKYITNDPSNTQKRSLKADFQLNYKGKKYKTFSTDENGNASIAVDLHGKGVTAYQLIETKTPAGLTETGGPWDIGVRYNNEVKTVYCHYKSEVDQQQQYDPYTIQVPNGDITYHVNVTKKAYDGTIIAGATFGVTTSDGKSLGTITTDANGSGTLEVKNYVGTLYVQETSCPDPYVKSSQVQTIDIIDPQPNQTYTADFVDKRVGALKVDTKGNPVKGAHMQVVDTAGTVYDEWETDGTSNPHYIKGLTEGGSYILKESKAADGYVRAADVPFTVSGGYEDQIIRMKDKQYYVRKQDIHEKNLDGAHMQVLDASGNVVDDWVTGPSTVVTDQSSKYYYYHPVNGLVEGGSYVLHEKEAPKGYVKAADEPFTVTGDDGTGTKMDQDQTMKDKQYFIRKTDIFEIPLDGAYMEVRDDSGNVVDQWVTSKETVIQEGEHKGYHAVSGLTEGQHYTLYETKAPENYVIATPEGFTVTGADGAGIKYDQEQTMKDKQLHVRKQDLGGNEVEGAKMQVIDKATNTVVDHWVSESKEHIVQNLEEGHTYILHEEASPDGYVVATDVEFYVNNNKINENYKMVDKRIRAIKTDVNRKNPIEGAKMSVIDKDSGKTVDTWTSGKKFHYINGLVEGKTYILREEKAPKGYVRANDVLFTVSRAKETQTVYMTDKRVLISKKGVKIDSEVQGAKMAIYESEDGKITNDVAVDTWTTTDKPHYADGLSEGHEYTLVELRAPKGFVKAKPITFIATAASEDGIKADQLEVMVDKIFDVTKTDVSGKKEVPGAKLTVTDSETGKVIDTWISTTKAHHVSGLEEGRTYTLTEKRAPKGYVTAESVQFYVTEEKVNQHYKMKDKQVTVTKTDITGKKEVPGATLVVTDKKTGKKVDSWTSTTKKHYVNGLVENHDYVLTERRAPKGYVQAESVTFRVTGEKVNQKHYMKDKQVTVTKTDITGKKEIPGATLIVREKGKIIDKWVSTSKPHPVSGLKEGHTYVLTEKRAPSGYVKAESVKFYVSKDKIDQKHYMKDKQVLVSKQDITNKKELPGAHLTVTDKKTGKVVDSWTSTNEQHPVSGLEENRKYILTEVTAPNGYLKAESIEFFVSKEKVIQHVKMFDRPVAPKTGDDTDSTFYIAGAAVSLIVIAGAVVMKLKKDKKHV